MARSNNLPSKKYMAGERTTRHLRFVFSVDDTETETYIDLAKALSCVNRRSYRQGLYYYVASMTVHQSGSAWVRAATVPDTWMTKAAWVRGYRIFREMQRRAMTNSSPEIIAKYHDYKVAMDGGHTFTGSLVPVYQTTDGSPAYQIDEWAQSVYWTDDPDNSIHDPNTDPHVGDSFKAHLVGPPNGSDTAWTSIGLIASFGNVLSYDPSGGIPDATSDSNDDPLVNLFDAGDSHDDIISAINSQNDLPPYDRDNMVGSLDDNCNTIVAQTATGSGAATVMHAGGFCVPFGLLKIITQDPADDTSADIGSIEVNIEMVPGTYHGVYAERAI